MKPSMLFAVAFCLSSAGCDQISARLAALKSVPSQGLGAQPVESLSQKGGLNTDSQGSSADKQVSTNESYLGRTPADPIAGNHRSASSVSSGLTSDYLRDGSKADDGRANKESLSEKSQGVSLSVVGGQRPASPSAAIEITRDNLNPKVNLNNGGMTIEMDSDSIRVRSGILENQN